MRHQAVLTIPITVIRHAPQPLHEQIAIQVGSAVEHGLLARRAQLPSTRTLAALLGVSRGVTAAAYELLFTQGYLESQPGSGTYIAGQLADHPRGARRPGRRERPEPVTDLRPGQVDTAACPLSDWRAAWRRASFSRPPAGQLPPLGLPELRRAVAEHISHTRGLSLAGREVVVTGGTAYGLRVVLEALGLRGPDLAIEEPVPPALHRAAGGDLEPAIALPVDAAGANLDSVPAGCRAIVVSADAQVPLGHVLSAQRRLAAVAWGSATGGHVIEIACDTVFRPEASRLPRLHDPAGARSILVGGFCELLTPALKLGYAVVPRDLAGPVGRYIRDHAEQPPYVTQLAVATLLQEGAIVRLMHRLGRRYAGRRRLVEAALTPLLPRIRLGARRAVNTEVLYLPDRVDPRLLADQLLGQGVRVATLTPYHFSGRAVPPALVIGFGHQPDPELRRGLSRLVDALGGLDRRGEAGERLD